MKDSIVLSGYEQILSGKGERVLVLLMPGVLMSSEKGFKPVVDILREWAQGVEMNLEVVHVDYRRDEMVMEDVVNELADQVRLFADTQCYDQILPVGLSLSGMVINHLYYAVSDSDILSRRPILVDSPFGATFPGMARHVAGLARYLKFGERISKLVNLKPDRFTGHANMPKPPNIGNSADFASLTEGAAVNYQGYIDWVIDRAREGLFGQKLTQFVSMAGQMAGWDYVSFPNGVRPTYIVCTDADIPAEWQEFKEPIIPDAVDKDGVLPVERPCNDTVAQPEAVDRWITALAGNIDVLAVRSTHCGFMERPDAWRGAFMRAFTLAFIPSPPV